MAFYDTALAQEEGKGVLLLPGSEIQSPQVVSTDTCGGGGGGTGAGGRGTLAGMKVLAPTCLSWHHLGGVGWSDSSLPDQAEALVPHLDFAGVDGVGAPVGRFIRLLFCGGNWPE